MTIIKVADIGPNEFRDMTVNPIQPLKVKALVESMTDTTFWDNILVYKTDEGDEFPYRLLYGHHRKEALEEMGILEIDVHVREMDKEMRLRVMANENKGDWEFGNMLVITETVNQVRLTLYAQATQFKTFEEYNDSGFTFFATKKMWAQGQNIDNIGSERVQKFLGETWSSNDIRNAMGALKAVEGGYIDQSHIAEMPSVGMLNSFQKTAVQIHDKGTYPMYFKQKYVEEMYAIIVEGGATVALVNKLSGKIKNQTIPTTFLRSQKIEVFNLVNEVFKLIDDDEFPLKLEDVPDTDGLGLALEEDDLKELMEALDAKILKVAESRAKKAEKEAAKEAGEVEAASDAPSDDAQAAISDAESKVTGDDTAGTVPMENLPEFDEEDIATPLGQMAQAFCQSAATMTAQTEELAEKTGEFEEGMVQDNILGSYSSLYRAVITLGLKTYGAVQLKATMDEIEKGM